jgi:hypothetical protein
MSATALAQELILPPNALIVGVYAYSPSGAVTEYKATDYLVAFDDGTPLLTISAALATSGFSASATNLMIPIGTGMQKRKVKLIAGGAFGNSVQQYNNQGRVAGICVVDIRQVAPVPLGAGATYPFGPRRAGRGRIQGKARRGGRGVLVSGLKFYKVTRYSCVTLEGCRP